MDNEKTLFFIKRNRYNMPVYQDEEENLYIDIDCREGRGRLHTVFLNDLSNGPDLPVSFDTTKCKFIPERIWDSADSKLQMYYW